MSKANDRVARESGEVVGAPSRSGVGTAMARTGMQDPRDIVNDVRSSTVRSRSSTCADSPFTRQRMASTRR
jgi:hypothetical protein